MKEPFPENLSFEEILTSIGGGTLLSPLPEPHKHIDTSMTISEMCTSIENLDLFPNPGNLVDVKV